MLLGEANLNLYLSLLVSVHDDFLDRNCFWFHPLPLHMLWGGYAFLLTLCVETLKVVDTFYYENGNLF